MKSLNYCFVSLVCFALLGSKCAPPEGGQPQNTTPPGQAREGIDLARVETNWTQLAQSAKASGQWDSPQKKWKNPSFEGKLPAYVPVFADCGSTHLGDVKHDPIGKEILELAAAAAVHSKIVLVGEPGEDVDARVQALAWQIAKQCSSAAALYGREVVSIDLSTIKDDVLAKKLPDIQYIVYVKQVFEQIIQKHGARTIYYLNEFPVLSSTNVDPESILRIFLDAKVSVIIEATPAEFNRHFASRLGSVKPIILAPLPSELVLPAASALAPSVSVDIVEDIVRLTRGFLPERGLLQNAAEALKRMGPPSRNSAIAAVASLDGRLQTAALAKSNALDRGTSLAELDANVALSRRYYLDQQTKEDFLQGAKQAMEPVIAGIIAKLSEVEKRITESLTEQVRELQSNIDKLGAKLDAASLELAHKLLTHTQVISGELAIIVNRQDVAKAELLAKIAESQDTLLANFNAKFSKLSDAQQQMFEQLSTSHREIADAVASLQAGSKEQMAKIDEVINQQLALEKNLDDKTAALGAALSKTNADLASVVLRLNVLTSDQKKLFDSVTSLQGIIANTILPKISELSETQKRTLVQITTGLDTISRSVESTEQKIMMKISDNYQALLVIIENNKNALIADTAEKVAQLNTTFANEIARLDEQGAKQKNEINVRIDGAVSSLTEALKVGKTDLAKSIGNLSVALEVLTSKVTTLDQKASDSEKKLLVEIASATQKTSDSLKDISAANRNEVERAIAYFSKTRRDLVKRVDDLGSEVLAHKTEMLKEITDKVKDATDKLTDAVASGKNEALAEAKKANDALAELTTKLGTVELRVGQLQRDLSDKAQELDTKIDKVSSTLDSISRELAEEIKDNTFAISNQLTDIVKRQDLDKAEVLEKIVNAQEALLKDFTAKLGTHSIAQEEKFKDVSKAHEKLADSVAKADKAGATKLAEIVAQQLAFEKALSTATAQFASDVSKTNGELATLVVRVDKLSAEQQKLFDTISAVQKEITDTVLPKIAELSNAQKDALKEITNGLSLLSIRIDSSEQKALNQIAANYQDLLSIIEKAKDSAIADAAGKVASLNTALGEQIARVDSRIENAVTSLTQSIKNAASSNKIEFAKSTGDLSITLEALAKKVDVLDEKILSSVKNATEQLSQAISTGDEQALKEANKANLALADLTSRLGRVETNVENLQRSLEANLKEAHATINSLEAKIERGLHAEISRANKELSDALYQAMASGDQKVMDAVNWATLTHKDLVRTVDNLSTQVLTNKLDILQKLEDKVKESTDALKTAIATQREEDIAKLDRLQNDVGTLSNRLAIVEGEVAQLKIVLANGLKKATEDIETAKKNVSTAASSSELAAINELTRVVTALKTQVDTLGKTVSQQKTDLLSELTTRCSELAATWENAVKEKTEAAVKPLIDTLNQLTQKTNNLGDHLTAAKQDAGAKIDVLLKDHGALKSQVDELIKSKDSQSLKTAEAIANAQKALADRVDAVEKRGPEYDAIWKELRAANKNLREELDVSIQAAKNGATQAHRAALEQIKELADKQAGLAQSLANSDTKIAMLESELKDLRDDFIKVYKFLFRQPKLLQASEQKRKRKVEILENCLSDTLDREKAKLSENPNLLIVECGVNCLVVDKEFGLRAGESGDRRTSKFFEFELDIGLAEDKPTVRCIPKAFLAAEPSDLHSDEPIKVSKDKQVPEPNIPVNPAPTQTQPPVVPNGGKYIELQNFSDMPLSNREFAEFAKYNDEGLLLSVKDAMEKHPDLQYPLVVVYLPRHILGGANSPILKLLKQRYYVAPRSLVERDALLHVEKFKVGATYTRESEDLQYEIVRIYEREPVPDSAKIAFDCGSKKKGVTIDGIKGEVYCAIGKELLKDTDITKCFSASSAVVESLPGFRMERKESWQRVKRDMLWSFSYDETEDKSGNHRAFCEFVAVPWVVHGHL